LTDVTPKTEINKADARPARTVAMMMAIMVIGKAMGLMRESMQAMTFGGDTPYAVAFVQASSLPNSFLDIMFAAALSSSFIPVFSTYLETKGKRAAFDLASLFISITLVLTAAVAIISIIFATPLYYLVFVVGRETAPSMETRLLAIELLRYMFPLMILSGLAFSFTGILQSLGEFRLPAAMSVVSNGAILLYYFLFVDRFGVRGLAVAFLMGWAMQALIQVPWLYKHRFRFRFRINLRDSGLRQIGALALPVMVASWVLSVNYLVNLSAASGLYGGDFGAPAIRYAHTLFVIVSGVFVLSVSNVIFPKLSRQVANKDSEGFKSSLQETVRVMFFFLLPLTFGMMALNQPLVQLLFGRGEFCERAVEITATALFFFSAGTVGYGLQVMLSRACFAQKDGRTPLVAAVVAIGVNGVLSFALLRLEIAGPALAGAIGITLGAAVMAIALTYKGLLTWPAGLVADIIKMALLAVLMFFAVKFTLTHLRDSSAFLQVLVPAAVGVVLYFSGCWLLQMKEIAWIKQNLRGNRDDK